MRRFAPGPLLSVCCLLVFTVTPTLAKDHASKYEVGLFLSTERLSDGTYSYASCNRLGCSGSAHDASHNVHYVQTPEGLYAISAPVSVAGTFFLSLGTPGGNSPTVHKMWFMDDLHDSDQVLFTAKCNHHNICQFWLPNPDKPGKEFVTSGSFHPVVSKTNTTSLCGTGRLSAAVEQQVCVPTASPASVPNQPPKQDAQFQKSAVLASTSVNSVPGPHLVADQISQNSFRPVKTTTHTSNVSRTFPMTFSGNGDILGLSGADWEQGGVKGVEVVEVSEDSSAQNAGLHKGDVITKVNGKRVRSNQELSNILEQIESGSTISIGYIFNTNLGWMPAQTATILGKED